MEDGMMDEGKATLDQAARYLAETYTRMHTEQRLMRHFYAGNDPKPRDLKEIVHEESYFGEDYSIDEFKAWMDEKVAAIPEEWRDTARIEIGYDNSYDSCHGTIEISYTRKETETEVAERLAGYAEVARRQDATERAELERLKAKFAANP